MPNQPKVTRIKKDEEHKFTRIVTDQGEYELWNSLDQQQENEVLEQLKLEKGSLPLASKKDQESQKLLFGEGRFGKVRLAKKADTFYAVKKVKDGKSLKTAHIEHKFGTLLAAVKIPHVANVVDSEIAVDERGVEKLYLFMDKIASLGNGDNLINLLSYIESKEEREAILKHAAISILESAAAMHKHNIYHRDLKASNILINSNGQIYLSDFGSAIVQDSQLISDVLLMKDTNSFHAANEADPYYRSPEILLAIKQDAPLRCGYDAPENWRIGLTLLQLCGCINEGDGILDDLKSWAKRPENTPEKIKDHFRHLIADIKLNSLDKIPEDLRDVIFGLLDVDEEKRLTAQKALNQLQQKPLNQNDPALVNGFKNLTKIQVAEITKKRLLGMMELLDDSMLAEEATQEPESLKAEDEGLSMHEEEIRGEEAQTAAPLPRDHEERADETALQKTKMQLDPEFEKLAKELHEDLEKILKYTQIKVGNSASFAAVKTQSRLNLNSILQSLRKALYPSRILGIFTRKKAEIQVSEPTLIDQKAVSAVFQRQQQIVSQLTPNKLVAMNDSERFAVREMLEKDRKFLQDILAKTNNNTEDYQDHLDNIDSKLQLLDSIGQNKVIIRYGKSDDKVSDFTDAYSYVAKEVESGKVKYAFSKLWNFSIYDLPSPFTQLFRSFVADQTVKGNQNQEDIHIYTSDKSVGQAIAQTILPLEERSKRFKIFVNDVEVSNKHGQSATKNLGFFNVASREVRGGKDSAKQPDLKVEAVNVPRPNVLRLDEKLHKPK